MLHEVQLKNSFMIRSIIQSFVLFLTYKTQAVKFTKIKFDPAIESLSLRSKTRLEVAEEYSISVETLRSWLKKAKIRIPPGLISPRNLKIIYYTFGIP
jgi:hypothetical protein